MTTAGMAADFNRPQRIPDGDCQLPQLTWKPRVSGNIPGAVALEASTGGMHILQDACVAVIQVLLQLGMQ